MASPGFGFSVGDIIAAGKLIKDLSKALRDVGGAADDYRQVVTELELLEDVFLQMQTSHAGATSSHIAHDPFALYTKQQVDRTLQNVTCFLKSVSRFDAKLGLQAKPGKFRGMGRKAQWAITQAQEAERMRAKLDQLVILKLLQDLYVLQAFSTVAGV